MAIYNGTAGNDTYPGNNDNSGDDIINGNDGNDQLDGGAGNDTINGGAGFDTIIVNNLQGVDSIDGGSGINTLRLSNVVSQGGATIDLRNASNINVLPNGTIFTNFSVFVGTLTNYGDVFYGGEYIAKVLGGGGDDLLVGGSGKDATSELVGGDDDDTLIGGGDGATDTLIGAAGDDLTVIRYDAFRSFVDGGDGIDTLQVDDTGRSSNLLFDASNPRTTNPFRGDIRFIQNIEQYDISSGSGNDSLVAGNGNDTLDGGLGRDTLKGGAGNDLIVYRVGEGPDAIDGGADIDTLQLDYSTTAAAQTIDLSPSKLGNNPLGDGASIASIEQFIILGSTGNDSVLAGSGADALSGGNGADTMLGGAGDDVLNGDANNDSLNGGTGTDTLNGGDGDDALYSNSNQGPDALDGGTGIDFAKIDRAQSTRAFSFDLTNPGTLQTLSDGTTIVNVERIQFEAGSANDLLIGGALADVLAGNDGSDTLNGGGGDDVLIAGRGFNQIDGGAGSDVLQVTGRRADYVFSRNGDGTVTATNPSSFVPDRSGAFNPEVDTFSNIETIHFADGYAKLAAVVR